MGKPTLDEKTTQDILMTTKKEMGWYDWKNKQSIMFHLKSKYGDSLDNDLASKLYDKIIKDNNH